MSEAPIDMEAEAIEKREITAEDVRRDHKSDRTGSGCGKRVFAN
jgi:hypothetical protein